jgi:hypothetical protein
MDQAHRRVIMLLAGIALFRGAVWARTIGVIVAIISGIVNFAWLPWYPFWAFDRHSNRHHRDLGSNSTRP